MRISHFSILALSGLAIATPVLQKRADVTTLLTDLFATVQIYTGAINATLAPLSPSSSLLDKTTATVQVGAKLNLITAAVTATTNEIQALPPTNSSSNRLVRSNSDPALPKEKRQLLAISALLSLLIVEIFATITAAVAILGLAGLLVFLNPLTGAISAFILAVQLVLDVVLVGVIALLNSLLTGLALGVSGL